MMWYWGSGAHWWAWLLGAIGMVAFWGLLVWGIWFFVVSATRRPDHDHASGGARRILDERLARGEIDPEEYRRLRDLITDGDRVPATAGDRR
jgi:putative membrane protein